MRRSIVAASIGTAVALGGGAIAVNVLAASHVGAVSAADSSATTPSTAPARQLPDPFTKAIQGLVDNKTLTQAQADAVIGALEQAGPQGGRGGRGGPRGGAPVFGGSDVLAKALGVTADELRTALESGKSIGDLAKEKGVDVQKVIDALVAEAKTRIQQRVTDGKATQTQADDQLAKLTDAITKMVNGQGGPGFGGPMGGPGGPMGGPGGPMGGPGGRRGPGGPNGQGRPKGAPPSTPTTIASA